MAKIDHSILEAALIGYESERERMLAKIAEIQAALGNKTRSKAPGATFEAKPKRKMSAKGKAAIRAGVRKRWAAFHAAEKASVQAKPKKKLSPARKAALIANLKKARAARAAKRNAEAAQS